MRRSDSFDELLSKELKNPKYAQGYFLELIKGDDGLSLETALKETVKSMGIKEFSEVSKIPPSNIVDFIKDRRTPKPETLNQYLKPFRLKIKLTVEKIA
jgi:predicted transcriptional regulator